MSEPDFSFFAQMEVDDGSIAELPLRIELPNGTTWAATLIGRHAGEKNAAYFNLMLKRETQTRGRRKSRSIQVSTLRELREADRELFPSHVITDWRGVRDASGAEVPYSVQACAQLIRSLPDDIFDEIRKFFADLSNFSGSFIEREEALDAGKS